MFLIDNAPVSSKTPVNPKINRPNMQYVMQQVMRKNSYCCLDGVGHKLKRGEDTFGNMTNIRNNHSCSYRSVHK